MGMAVDNGLECFDDGQVDVVRFAGGNDRRKGPIVSPDLIPGEQSIFSGQADWPDGVLDRVRVELEAIVFEEAGQP